ncbi:MAG TPA: TolC family protein [Candidatus Marinimicrobia bacterium]|nr:TolC family protein [Candidatus Neomarinimicrobiota bacterium]
MMNFIFSILILSVFISAAVAQGYDLAECIGIALDNKQTLYSAELEVQSAEKGVTGSYSGLLPSVNLSTSSGRTHYPEQETISLDFENNKLDTSVSRSTSSMSTGLSINQTLYDGGRSFNTVRQARTNLDIARLNQRQTRIQVIQNVASSYYGLLQAQQLLDVAEKNLNLSEQQVDLVQKQFDVGAVRKTDLLKADVARGQAKVDVLNRKTALDNARRQLFNDMGMQDFGQSISAVADEWTDVQVPSSADALELLKTKNPSLLIQQSRISLGVLQVKMAKGVRLPSLGASMSYSANGENSDALMEAVKDDWIVGMNLSLSVPLYSGSRLSTNQQQAKLSQQKSENDYITYLNDLRVQVELLRKSLENYSEIIPINQSVVVSAEEDLKLVQARYSLGSATILEVLDAQVSLIRSNSNLINTVHNARIREKNLKAILGTLDLDYQTKEE